MSVDEKVEIARQLSRLGVDVCEAGFPIASQGDFEAVKRIATEIGPITQGRLNGPMIIAGLARATNGDIQRAYDAVNIIYFNQQQVKYAPLHRIHTFLATSDIHLEHKLKITREQCIQKAVSAVQFAKSLGCTDIEFSPEDAGRSDQDFLCKVLSAVILAGATTLNIPDTVGYNLPEDYGFMMKYLINNTIGSETVIWSTHCHNDLGLATANTLSGIRNGARQVEVTINGIGERAGNTALEEIVMALYTHPNVFSVFHSIDTIQIHHTSQLVSKRTGMSIQPNKAIVGANAFSHESGIHQDGYLKNKSTYEIIQPEIIGLTSRQLVLGKHSGRHAFKSRMEELLIDSPYSNFLSNNQSSFEILFEQFKILADCKKSVMEDDLYALLDSHFQIHLLGVETFILQSVQVFGGMGMLSTATVSVLDKSTKVMHTDAATGNGPVNALFSVISRLVGIDASKLVSYEVSAVTGGMDALARVIVRIRGESNVISVGQGVDVDVLVASAKAYLNAVNKISAMNEKVMKVGGSQI